MRLKGLDLNLLLVLDMLLQECNVSRAAHRLGLKQSTVSSSLARLREHFGDELLVKGTPCMLPTALSHELAPQVRQWLAQLDGLLDPAPVFDPGQCQATLRLACCDVAATRLVPSLAGWLAKAAPAVRLQLLGVPRLSGAELDAWMLRQQIDCLIAPQPASQAEPLYREDWLCVARSGSAPALSAEDFERLPHVRAVGQYLPGDEHRCIQARVPGYLALEAYVQESDCLACLPRSLAAGLGDAVRVHRLPIEAADFVLQASWAAETAHEPVHAWLRSAVAACGAQLQPDGALPCAIGL